MSEQLTFGSVEIRPAQRQLVLEGRPAALGSRAFDVLMGLVERRDRVVSKAELLDLAWPGMVVEENNLSVQISTLRKVLGAQAIATVTGRGYRFTLVPEEAAAAPRSAASGSEVMRRLATLLHGEVRSWQRLARAAPQTAVQSWRELRSTLIEPGVPAAGGRIIELAAEGMLFEFASPVEAMRWVLQARQRLAEQPRAPGGEALALRMAMCIEDIIVDEGRPVGEAAQTASRLLAAAPEHVDMVVTDAVRAILRERLPARYAPLGNGTSAWCVEFDAPNASPRAESALALAAAPHGQRATIAALPFSCAEDDAYFGDGMTEEIIASLSANRSLMVIARNSTLRYRASALPLRQIAAELGVRYLLSGTAQRAPGRLRLLAQLVDAQADRVIWSQRYEGEDKQLFDFQSEIAASIAGAVDPRVTEAEIERVALVPTASLGAYDCVLSGLALQVTFNDADFASAGDYFRRAVELDPRYAQAHAHLAWWHNLRVGESRSSDVQADAKAAEELSMRAMALDGRDALVLSIAAHIQGFVKHRLEVAAEMFEQALAINPSCAFGWARSATAAAFLGRGEEAQRRVRLAMRLSPFDQQGFTFLTNAGTAAMVLGQFDEAVAWYGKARRANPRYRAAWRMLVAALALAGEMSEAHEQAAEFVQFDPGFRVSNFARWYAMREPHLGTVLRGMRLAGLPE